MSESSLSGLLLTQGQMHLWVFIVWSSHDAFLQFLRPSSATDRCKPVSVVQIRNLFLHLL